MSWNDGEYFATSFHIHKWCRYHQKRRDFYHRLYVWRAAVSIFCGSAAFVLFLQPSWPQLAAFMSAVSALGAALELLFRCERSAHSHHIACRSFGDLGAKLERWEPTIENLKKAKEARFRISPDPPQIVRVLVELVAHNEEARARGVPESDLVPLSPAQLLLGHCCTFGMRRIERWKAEKESAESLAVAGAIANTRKQRTRANSDAIPSVR